MAKETKNTKEESTLNIKEIEQFFKRIGIALTAYSIFLYTFLEILGANYINDGSAEHTIFLALLFGIIVIIGYFILEVSQKFDSKIVALFGLVVFGLPWLLYTVLQEKIKTEIYSGGFVIIGLLAILGGIAFVNFIFTKSKNKWENKKIFYVFSVLIPLIVFLITKFTGWTQSIFVYSRLNTGGIIQSAVLGFELGLNYSIIVIPILFILTKIFDSKKN